jgi:light-regulated signal transduction histidine kinase (bacteriophytochrome)
MQPTRSNYDSEFCGKLPLHRINVIQPHGALLVVQPDNLNIVQVSQNTHELIGLFPDEILEKPVSILLSEEGQVQLARLLSLPANSERLPEQFTIETPKGRLPFQVIVHKTPDYLLFEMEPDRSESAAPTFKQLYQDLRYTMVSVNSASGMIDACSAALLELKRLSGFDRIMVYQFDEDWNGNVVAEIREEGMEPYLGLRFPASDIPKGARELYHLNPYRLIPDRNYEPVKLQPVINPITGTFTDMSVCNLRGVAGVHLEYLANMGVQASMSARILFDGKLWGLVSCHHRTVKHLSYEEAAVFELLSDVLSAKIEALQTTEFGGLTSELQRVQATLMERLFLEKDLSKGLLGPESNLCNLLQSDGAAVVSGRQVDMIGSTPNKTAIEELVFWLQSNHSTGVRHWNKLAEAYEPAADFADVASGLIALPIRPEKGEFLLGFRPEMVRQVDWGGNPEEAIQFEPGGVRYHPRKSFDIWRKTVRGTAVDWTTPEIVTAERFRNFVQQFLLREL